MVDKHSAEMLTGLETDIDMDMIHLVTAIVLPPGGSSTIHIYIQTVHGTA
jgi:hypothetical protein